MASSSAVRAREELAGPEVEGEEREDQGFMRP